MISTSSYDTDEIHFQDFRTSVEEEYLNEERQTNDMCS